MNAFWDRAKCFFGFHAKAPVPGKEGRWRCTRPDCPAWGVEEGD